MNACWTGCSAPASRACVPARPSTVTTSRPAAWPAATRHAHTGTSSSSTVHDPHSPCSQAFFEPGSASRSRSTNSRLSPSHTSSAVASSPLTVNRHPHPLSRLPLGTIPGPGQGPPGQHAQGVPAVGRRAAHVVDGPRRRRDQLAEPPGDRLRQRPRRFPQSRPGQRAGQELLRRRRPAAASARPSRCRCRCPAACTAGRRAQFQRERADGDDHRVPRADLGELLGAGRGRDQHRGDQLVRGQRVALGAGEELGRRDQPRAADRRRLDGSPRWPAAPGGSPRPARRRRGCRRPCPRLRICGDPTVRAAIARPGSSAAQLGDDPGVGHPGPEPHLAVAALQVVSSADLVQVQQRRPAAARRS